MKVVQVNITASAGSTGKICAAVSRMLTQAGTENYILYSAGSSDLANAIRYQKPYEVKRATIGSRLLGNWGFEATAATKRLITRLEEIRPDIVHLHNLHGHNADLGLLLPYLAKSEVKVFWTFHDCWAFTGYCPHYTMAGCDKWRSGCGKCPQKRSYSWIFDRSAALYEKKKELLPALDLTVITPSHWLAGQVKKSFLADCDVRVIHNGINLQIFCPTASDFRARHGLTDKKIILGVAFGWGERKGLDVFIRMAKELPDHYRIVLVGTNDSVDRQLPDNILSIHRTADQHELAQIYTAADVFVNPTREENYPTVHMEALACGTPVVAFDVGGCGEAPDKNCGILVEKENYAALLQAIGDVCERGMLTRQACLDRALSFSDENMLKEYSCLYEKETAVLHHLP